MLAYYATLEIIYIYDNIIHQSTMNMTNIPRITLTSPKNLSCQQHISTSMEFQFPLGYNNTNSYDIQAHANTLKNNVIEAHVKICFTKIVSN
jgi:hypothetical protein